MSTVGAEPGPVGEEAAKLLAAAQEWLHRSFGDPASARIATGAQECAWCPVCQLIGVLRGGHPEIAERFAETQTALAGLLRCLADTVATTSPGRGHRQDGPRVQQIDLTGNDRDGE